MSISLNISARAEADLTHQYRWYLDNAGLQIAERFLSAFDATATKLSKHPHLGRIRKFRASTLANIRSFPISDGFGVHLVFYRSTESELKVMRVMHGARNLPVRLLEPPN